MEGLVSATASTFQLILEHLCAVLLLISEGWRHVPVLPAFLWVIQVGALVMVSLMVKRQYTSRSVKALSKKYLAHDEVSAGWSEDTGPMTDDGAPKPPEAEASPLRLQTLCLKALNRHLSRMLSLQDLADLVKAVCKSHPPKCSHVTSEKPTSKASGTEGEQLQKNIGDDLNKDTRYLESPELCQGDITGQKWNIQKEEEEEKQRLEQSKAPVERVLQGRVSQSVSEAGNPLQTSPRPEVLRGRLAHVMMQAEPQREAENGDQFVHGSEDGLKGVPRDADCNMSLPCADEEDQGRARELREQKQINEALAADIIKLQTEKASLQRENSKLNAEIQQLKLKLQIVPDTQEDRFTQLQKQLFEAERRCLEMEKKLLNDWRNMNSAYWRLNNYKKMVQDMKQDLRRSTFYYEREIRYHQERAEAALMAAQHMERKLQELRRENDRNRQMLAKAKTTFQPFPGGPFAPTAPPAAHGVPGVPVHPLGHWVPRKDQGHTARARKSRVTFQV